LNLIRETKGGTMFRAAFLYSSEASDFAFVFE